MFSASLKEIGGSRLDNVLLDEGFIVVFVNGIVEDEIR